MSELECCTCSPSVPSHRSGHQVNRLGARRYGQTFFEMLTDLSKVLAANLGRNSEMRYHCLMYTSIRRALGPSLCEPCDRLSEPAVIIWSEVQDIFSESGNLIDPILKRIDRGHNLLDGFE